MTITEFLEARISEDEAALERTGPFPHSIHGGDLVGTYRSDCPDCIGVPNRARVLAECAAKRAIMKEHAIDLEMREPYCDTCAQWWNCVLGEGPPMVKYPCPTIQALAAVYKDHPDYRQEWARG